MMVREIIIDQNISITINEFQSTLHTFEFTNSTRDCFERYSSMTCCHSRCDSILNVVLAPDSPVYFSTIATRIIQNKT